MPKIRRNSKPTRAVHNFDDFKDRQGNWVRSFNINTQTEYLQYHTRMNVIWNNINLRVNPGEVQNKEPTYIGCKNNFKSFQEFAEWCNETPEYRNKDLNGRFWELDKDLVAIGNKSYSSETCCFIPQSINRLLNCRENSRGDYPMGVNFEAKAGRIRAACRTGNTTKFLGYFEDPLLAHRAWQEFKIVQIEKVLESFGNLPRICSDGLMLRIARLRSDVVEKRETLYI